MTLTYSSFTNINQYINIFKACLDKVLEDNYPRYKALYPDYFKVINHDKKFFDATVLSGFGLFQEIHDDIETINTEDPTEVGQKRLTIVDYGKATSYGMSTITDDMYGVIKKMTALTGSISVAERSTRDVLAANILNYAFTAGHTGGYDNHILCSNAHPNTVSGGTWSNVLATPADLSYSSLNTAITMLQTMPDLKNIPMKLMPKKLVVHPENIHTAYEILHSEKLPDTNYNNVNAINSMYNIEIVANPFLTDTDAWFLIADDPVGSGLVFINRANLGLDVVPEPEHRKVTVVYVSRFTLGWIDPHFIIGTPGA